MQQAVSAIAIPAAEARLLGVRSRATGLHLVRYCFASNERPLARSINTDPAGRFRFSTRSRLESKNPDH